MQIRQRVEHKRTFFFLEQLILARRMQSKVLDIELEKDGMNLYFAEKHAATAFVAFLGTVVPARSKVSRKLISEDRRNNVHRNQHTMVVEIAPLCKDDLVLLPAKGAGGVGGGLQGFVLVSRVTSVLHLVDPTTLARAELPAAKYWRHPLEAVMTSKDLVQFEVGTCACVRAFVWVVWFWLAVPACLGRCWFLDVCVCAFVGGSTQHTNMCTIPK